MLVVSSKEIGVRRRNKHCQDFNMENDGEGNEFVIGIINLEIQMAQLNLNMSQLTISMS